MTKRSDINNLQVLNNISLCNLITDEHLEKADKLEQINEVFAEHSNIDLNIPFDQDDHLDLDGLYGGSTVLHAAASEGNVDIINLLVTKGAKVNVYNTAGMTPLDNAVINGKKEAVETLINLGADVNAYGSLDMFGTKNDTNISPPLWHALEEHLQTSDDKLQESYHSIANSLIDSGANVRVGGGDPHSLVIQQAAKAGLCDTVEKMLDRGANVNGDDPKSLSDNGADDTPPLGYAVEYKNIPLIKLLLDRGADTERFYNGKTPFKRVQEWGNPEVLEAFERQRARVKQENLISEAKGIMPSNLLLSEPGTSSVKAPAGPSKQNSISRKNTPSI